MQATKHPLGIGSHVIALALLASFAALTAQSQTGDTATCVIASNDDRNGFRTDEISGCRIDTANGNASFAIKQETRSISYASIEPLITRHLEAAAYWLSRTNEIRVPANTNPNGFYPQGFLQEVSRATHGFVLVRNKRNGGQALNVVYVTNGVYRSIDFPGNSLTKIPSGFLTTR